jgi:hypothetical protein
MNHSAEGCSQDIVDVGHHSESDIDSAVAQAVWKQRSLKRLSSVDSLAAMALVRERDQRGYITAKELRKSRQRLLDTADMFDATEVPVSDAPGVAGV